MAWKTILSALGGMRALRAIAAFLGKKWLGSRIEESVKNEYATKLEEHKAALQEQVHRTVQSLETESHDAVDAKVADKALFAKFMETLPSSGSIEFIANFNMSGFSFARNNLEQLDNFDHEWERPEYHFLDQEIDAKRQALHKVVREYLTHLSYNTFPLEGNSEASIVPPEWEEEQPERFKEVVGKLHELARQIVSAHEDLVATARGRLKC